MSEENYLGDGLYASYDGFQIRLYTPEGNEVFLEPAVFERFLLYAQKIFKVEISIKQEVTNNE